MQTTPSPLNLPPATLRRRLGAVLYDSLLLTGTLVAASALVLLVIVGLMGAEQVKLRNPLISNPFFSTYLFFIGFFFYAWFWTHGGQTLGMRAWKIRIQQLNGHGITWWQALLRFLLAGLWVLPIFYARKVLNLSLGSSLSIGLCFLLLTLVSRLHDRYSGTVLVVIKTRDQPMRSKA